MFTFYQRKKTQLYTSLFFVSNSFPLNGFFDFKKTTFLERVTLPPTSDNNFSNSSFQTMFPIGKPLKIHKDQLIDPDYFKIIHTKPCTEVNNSNNSVKLINSDDFNFDDNRSSFNSSTFNISEKFNTFDSRNNTADSFFNNSVKKMEVNMSSFNNFHKDQSLTLDFNSRRIPVSELDDSLITETSDSDDAYLNNSIEEDFLVIQHDLDEHYFNTNVDSYAHRVNQAFDTFEFSFATPLNISNQNILNVSLQSNGSSEDIVTTKVNNNLIDTLQDPTSLSVQNFNDFDITFLISFFEKFTIVGCVMVNFFFYF